jgi:putative ABC transport system substrate-binding protein
MILPGPIMSTHAGRIAQLAVQNKLPAIYFSKEFSQAGGLISYGADVDAVFRHAAVYVDKILKGAKPDELPVQQPDKFELVINLKTATALGITVPQSLLIGADEVIE